ncbi:3855_t:CDS:2, partial [Cetraspora pellucida]
NFKQQCINTGLTLLQLISDNNTRWNSTNLIIERALYLQKAIQNIILINNDLKIYELSDFEWNYLQKIYNILQ